MKEVLFYLVVLLANIIQGITGFSGTILAMPFSVRLVGMDVAVPVLNVLGLLSGIYVFAGNRKHVQTEEIKRILAVTVPAVIAGLLIRRWLSARPGILYIVLGAIVTATAVLGLWKMLSGREILGCGVMFAAIVLAQLPWKAGTAAGLQLQEGNAALPSPYDPSPVTTEPQD